MRFLFDECLHPSLVGVAISNGQEAYHVTWRGLAGTSDRDLIPLIIEGNFIFVTNNARDFRRLYKRQELHPGLIIFLPQVPALQQQALFRAVLDEIAGADLINEVIELSIDLGDVIFDRYSWPR